MAVKLEKDFMKKHGKKFLIAYLILVAINYTMVALGTWSVNGETIHTATNQAKFFGDVTITVLVVAAVPVIFVMGFTAFIFGIKNTKKQIQTVKNLRDEGLLDIHGNPTDYAKEFNKQLGANIDEVEKTSYTKEEIAFIVRQNRQINSTMSPTRLINEVMPQTNSRYVPKGENSYRREETGGVVKETFTSGTMVVIVKTQPNGARTATYRHKYWWAILLGFFIPFFAIIAFVS